VATIRASLQMRRFTARLQQKNVPLKADSTGFKDAIDESCWTPLNVSYSHRNEQFRVRNTPSNIDSRTAHDRLKNTPHSSIIIYQEYTLSKLLSEQELLAYNETGERPAAFEVARARVRRVAGDPGRAPLRGLRML
jgi:hypothetical protein